MSEKKTLNDDLAKVVSDVLRTRPEDWGDVDAHVLYARIMRLEAQLEALERHHRSVHPRCGEVHGQRMERPATPRQPMRAVDQRMAA